MELPTPQSEKANHIVDIRPNDSPRNRRYGSDEPVVTAAELYADVPDDDRPSGFPQPLSPQSRAVPFKDTPVPPIATVDPEPLEPPPRPMRRRRRFLVQRACCCLTLLQGTYFIGVLQVVNGLLLLLLEIMYLAGVMFVKAYALDDDLTGTLPENQLTWRPTDIAYASLSGILLFMDLITLLFACMLLHGARMGRPGYIRAWLIFTAVILAAGLGTWAGRITLEFMYRTSRGVGLIVRAIINLTPSIYFVIVVRSYYYQLLDQIAGIIPFSTEDEPLMRKAPPPYSSGTGKSDQAPPLERKRPLETSFDSPSPTTNSPPPVLDARFHLSLENDDDEGGFGPAWIQTRGPVRQESGQQTKAGRTGSGNDSEALPRVVATVSRDGEIHPVRNSGPLPHEEGKVQKNRDSNYDEEKDDIVEFRPLSRRVIGAGPMVLPPLPPGHRESLQHVMMELPLPPPPQSPSVV